MKRLRIYLDTSVISYLDQQDAPEQMRETRMLWKDLARGKYEIAVSDLTVYELRKCPPDKLEYLYTRLGEISYIDISQTEESEHLAALYSSFGGLPPKSKVDAMHIAIASVAGCNCILSWNFKHIVNLRAMTAVDAVNTMEGYAQLRILSPAMLLESEAL